MHFVLTCSEATRYTGYGGYKNDMQSGGGACVCVGGGYHVLHKTCHACLSVIECVQLYTSPGPWCSWNIPAQLNLALC